MVQFNHSWAKNAMAISLLLWLKYSVMGMCLYQHTSQAQRHLCRCFNPASLLQHLPRLRWALCYCWDWPVVLQCLFSPVSLCCIVVAQWDSLRVRFAKLVLILPACIQCGDLGISLVLLLIPFKSVSPKLDDIFQGRIVSFKVSWEHYGERIGIYSGKQIFCGSLFNEMENIYENRTVLWIQLQVPLTFIRMHI